MDSVIYFNIEKELSISNLKDLKYEDAPFLKVKDDKLVRYVDKKLKSAKRSKIDFCPEIEELYTEVSKVIKRKIVPIGKGGEIVKYNIGDFVMPHKDIDKTFSSNSIPRTLIYYIKVPLEGGDTVIDKKYKCEVGDVIIFDKNKTHSCDEILKGEKIIFIGDIFIEYENDIKSFLESKEMFLLVSKSILNEKLDPSLSLFSGVLFELDILYCASCEEECCMESECSESEPDSDASESDESDPNYDKYLDCEKKKIDEKYDLKDYGFIINRKKHKSNCDYMSTKIVIPFLFLDNKFIIRSDMMFSGDTFEKLTNYYNLPEKKLVNENLTFRQKTIPKVIKKSPLIVNFRRFRIGELCISHDTNYKLVQRKKDYSKFIDGIMENEIKLKVKRTNLKINYKTVSLFEKFLLENFKKFFDGEFTKKFESEWGRDGSCDINCYKFSFYVLVKKQFLYK